MNTETVGCSLPQLPPPVCEEVELTPIEEEDSYSREEVDEDEEEYFEYSEEDEDKAEEEDFFCESDFISEYVFQEKVMTKLIREARRWEDLPTWVIFRIMEVDEWWDEGIREYILTLKNVKGKTYKVWAPHELNNDYMHDLKGMFIRSTGYKLSSQYYASYDLVRK